MKTIILSGGIGSRLWPLSRKYFPKQYIKFEQFNNQSLFQMTFKRAMKISPLNDILIVTNKEQKFLVMGEIEELNINFPEKNIIVEPISKNTYPAICAAMQRVVDKALILPSDHFIEDDSILIKEIKNSEKLSDDYLITFGIKAIKAHTGYGYIKHKNGIVEEFKEKPNLDLANEYIKKGYLWNSGIFIFDKKVFFNHIKEKLPEDIEELYKILPENSIDYQILEKSTKTATIPLDIKWNDLGSFDSFHEVLQKNQDMNSLLKNTIFNNSKNNFIQKDSKKFVALQGVEDLIIVDTNDVLLICKKNESEKIKEITKKITKKNIIDFHTIVYRPWGSYSILEEQENFKVKKLSVYPNKILSLQEHNCRSENWVIVKGVATITKGEETFKLFPSQSVYIPQNIKHRLANEENTILEVIETQTGVYLGEDDIIRYEDKYGRK